MYKTIIFDLDGTLAESKQKIDDEMVMLLDMLLEEHKVVVISGGSWTQFKKQFLSKMKSRNMHKLFLFPTSGTSCRIKKYGIWWKLYEHKIPKKDKPRIKSILNFARHIHRCSCWPEPRGEIIEDRGSQITLSVLGQEARVVDKEAWAVTEKQTKKDIYRLVKKKLPNYEVRLGGSTSIDVTLKGWDKASAYPEIKRLTDSNHKEMLFMGDRLQRGGNDYPMKEIGIDCISVKTVQDTKKAIEAILTSE